MDKEGGVANVYTHLLILEKNELEMPDSGGRGGGMGIRRPRRSEARCWAPLPALPGAASRRGLASPTPPGAGSSASAPPGSPRAQPRRGAPPAPSAPARPGKRGRHREESAGRAGACTSRAPRNPPTRSGAPGTGPRGLLSSRRLRARLPGAAGPGAPGTERGGGAGYERRASDREWGGGRAAAESAGSPAKGTRDWRREGRRHRRGAPAGGARAPGPRGRCLPSAPSPAHAQTTPRPIGQRRHAVGAGRASSRPGDVSRGRRAGSAASAAVAAAAAGGKWRSTWPPSSAPRKTSE